MCASRSVSRLANSVSSASRASNAAYHKTHATTSVITLRLLTDEAGMRVGQDHPVSHLPCHPIAPLLYGTALAAASLQSFHPKSHGPI
jgi:hypothetical protein